MPPKSDRRARRERAEQELEESDVSGIRPRFDALWRSAEKALDLAPAGAIDPDALRGLLRDLLQRLFREEPHGDNAGTLRAALRWLPGHSDRADLNLRVLAVAIDDVARRVAPSAFSDLACCVLGAAQQLLHTGNRSVSVAHEAQRAARRTLSQWSSNYKPPRPRRQLTEMLHSLVGDARVDAEVRAVCAHAPVDRGWDELTFVKQLRRVAPPRAVTQFSVDRVEIGLEFGVAPDVGTAVWLVLRAAGLPWNLDERADPMGGLAVRATIAALIDGSVDASVVEPLRQFLGGRSSVGNDIEPVRGGATDPREFWSPRGSERIRTAATAFLSHHLTDLGCRIDGAAGAPMVAARIAAGALAHVRPSPATLRNLDWIAGIPPDADDAGSVAAHRWLMDVAADVETPDILARAGRGALACARAGRREPTGPSSAVADGQRGKGSNAARRSHLQFSKPTIAVWGLHLKSRCHLTLDMIVSELSIGRSTALKAVSALRSVGVIRELAHGLIEVLPFEATATSTKSELK